MLAAPQVLGQSMHEVLILLSMPLVGALIGWFTKKVLIEMLFEPLEFKGIGPFGWQGIVPRRAAKMANVAYETLTAELLRPDEIIASIDPEELVAHLDGPLRDAVDDIAADLAQRVYPELWDDLPETARRAVLARVKARAPQVIAGVLADVRRDLDDVFDLRYVVVSNLVRDKPALNRFFRDSAGAEMRFVRRSGLVFGFLIGTIQAVVYGITHNHWIIPVFGGLTGLITDYLALQMIFRPIEPRRFFGLFTWQGLFHKRRAEIAESYADIMAKDVFTPEVLIEGVLKGPSADRLFAIIRQEVERAIDEETRLARPLVTLTLGTARYTEMKTQVVEHTLRLVPEQRRHVEEYATKAFGLRDMLVEKINLLSAKAYEGLLRPVFKEDENLVVLVGAVLGFLVGEVQVQIVTRL